MLEDEGNPIMESVQIVTLTDKTDQLDHIEIN